MAWLLPSHNRWALNLYRIYYKIWERKLKMSPILMVATRQTGLVRTEVLEFDTAEGRTGRGGRKIGDGGL